MKIINPSAYLYTPFGPLSNPDGIKLIRWIEYNARISHRSEEAMTEDSWKKFIQSIVIEHGDWSVTEHSSVTVIFRVDRGVTHELVRHRLFSFTQESTRFVNYRKKTGELGIEFIQPSAYEDLNNTWKTAIEIAENAYMTMLADGSPPQIARSILPNALAATISVTGNLRNWRHFLLMRTSRETHPDFRRVTIPLLNEFRQAIPILYDDIEPNARQIDNLKKAR